MNSIGELKKERDKRFHALADECLMFFAFSDEQFHQNKTQLAQDEKYVSLGAGCYMPKGKVEGYKEGVKTIEWWFKNSVKDNKLREQNIRAALRNNEATYTGEIEDTMQELGEEYSEEEVQAQLQILQEMD